MKKLPNILFVFVCLLAPFMSRAQAFDPVLTFPPSRGPLMIDTGSYYADYNTPKLHQAPNHKKPVSANKKKDTERNQYNIRKSAEDSAWQQFINRPASMETKSAPKYINTKTGR